MLYQKIKRFWINILPNKRKSIVLLVLAMLVLCTGCKQNTDVETEEDKTEQQILVQWRCQRSVKILQQTSLE